MDSSLPLPQEVEDLIADGLWPTKENARMQNLNPILQKDTVRKFAPDEEGFFLYPTPLRTVEEHRQHNKYWNEPANALHEIDPARALFLADFGLGSDTAIILDYRKEPPELFRLQWGKNENHWIPLGLSLCEFTDLVRISRSEQDGDGKPDPVPS